MLQRATRGAGLGVTTTLSLALTTLRVAAALEQLLKGFRESSRLNQTQVLILLVLADPPRQRVGGWFREVATPNAIGRAIACGRTAAAMQIAGLQELGLIERLEVDELPVVPTTDQFDGRTRLYRLTAAGRTRARQAQNAISQVDNVLRTLLTAKGSGAASGFLATILKAFATMSSLDGMIDVQVQASGISRLRRKRRKGPEIS